MKYDFCVTTMFQNEGDIIEEWILFHQAQGVQNFYLYDHQSTDQSRSICLEKFPESLVTMIDLLEPDPTKARMFMLYDIRRRTLSETNWLAIIDVDELLFCPDAASTVLRVIEDIDSAHERVGAVVANWVCFGMPFDTPQQEMNAFDAKQMKWLTKYCTKRGAVTCKVNEHIKSIVKPAHWTDVMADPHGFNYNNQFRAVDTEGREVRGPFNARRPLDKLRIHHFMLRSIRHYTSDKLKRYAYNAKAGSFAKTLRRDAEWIEALRAENDDSACHVFRKKCPDQTRVV